MQNKEVGDVGVVHGSIIGKIYHIMSVIEVIPEDLPIVESFGH